MKKLTRMLMIRWYSYEKELIDFDMINFLTGEDGGRKVHYYRRPAAGNSRRQQRILF